MIVQYLRDIGLDAAACVLEDEAKIRMAESKADAQLVRRLRQAVTDGDWAEAETLLGQPLFAGNKRLAYAIHKQSFLEYVEHNERQKAFTHLLRRLKPLEGAAPPEEFRDLCYVLSARSIREVPSFRDWDGPHSSRDHLARHMTALLAAGAERSMGILAGAPHGDGADEEMPNTWTQALHADASRVPPGRLLELLQQAVSYQIEFSRYHPRVVMRIETLLEDYCSCPIPNACLTTCVGHEGNVKCVQFLGTAGDRLASGGSDNTVRLWDTCTGVASETLLRHDSRIWDLASLDRAGTRLASGSADGTVRIWDVAHASDARCVATLAVHRGDIYSLVAHPHATHLVSGGYDRSVRLLDARTGVAVRLFEGHELSVTRATFNPHGNLIVSGAKDGSVRFWDINSGLCVHTLAPGAGEISSVDVNTSGVLLLLAAKDNSNRLWDLRAMRQVQRLRGHQNTSKNFVRTVFGPSPGVVTGGSEDGIVYIWDLASGDVVQRLPGHASIVYSTAWNTQQSLLASCSDDCTVRTWWFDERMPIVCCDGDATIPAVA